MMMGNEWETYLTIAWLALWFMFPIGMFISVSFLDKTTDDGHQDINLSERPKIKSSKPTKGFHLPHWGLKH